MPLPENLLDVPHVHRLLVLLPVLSPRFQPRNVRLPSSCVLNLHNEQRTDRHGERNRRSTKVDRYEKMGWDDSDGSDYDEEREGGDELLAAEVGDCGIHFFGVAVEEDQAGGCAVYGGYDSEK